MSKDNETFEEWFNPFDEKLGQASKYEAIKHTWVHQQKKIDQQAEWIRELEQFAQAVRPVVEHYTHREVRGDWNSKDVCIVENHQFDIACSACAERDRGERARQLMTSEIWKEVFKGEE